MCDDVIVNARRYRPDAYDFIARQQAIHLLDPPGVGKTHLAIALGILAVKAGHAVYFTTLSDLIASLTNSGKRKKFIGPITLRESSTAVDH